MPTKQAPLLYKDSYLTEKDFMELYAKGGFNGVKDKEKVLSYILKFILDKDKVSYVKKQLKNGLDVNHKFEGVFYNLFSAAVICKAYKTVDELLRQGCDIHAGYTLENGHTRTPLHLAIQSGDLDMVEKLVKAGAHVNHANEDCMFTLAKTKYPILKYLLEHTEGPNLAALQNTNPFKTLTYWVACQGPAGIFEALCESFMRRPKEQALELFELIGQQLLAIDNYRSLDINVRPISAHRKAQAHQIYKKYHTLFEKQMLEQEISTSSIVEAHFKIHKI